MLFGPGLQGRNDLLLPLFHPTGMEWRFEIQTYFVHKEELEIVSEALFFISSSNFFAFFLAALSCK